MSLFGQVPSKAEIAPASAVEPMRINQPPRERHIPFQREGGTRISAQEKAAALGLEMPKSMPEPTGVKGAFLRRATAIEESRLSRKRGEQTWGETFLQAGGQAAAFGVDVLFEGVKNILKFGYDEAGLLVPEFIKDPVKKTVSKLGHEFMSNPITQKGLVALVEGVESWERFEGQHPRFARNIIAGFNVAQVGLVAKGAKPAAELVKKAGQKVTKEAIKKVPFLKKIPGFKPVPKAPKAVPPVTPAIPEKKIISVFGEVEPKNQVIKRITTQAKVLKKAQVDKDIDKIAQEIFQPSPDRASKDPRIIEGIRRTARVIKKADTFDELANQLKVTTKEVGKELDDIIAPVKDKAIDMNKLVAPIEKKLQFLSADAQTKHIADQMFEVWEKELINIKNLGGTLNAAQAQVRKMRLNNLLNKFFKKVPGQLTDLEVAKVQALNEIRRGYMDAVADIVPQIAAKNELYGALVATTPLAKRSALRAGNVLTPRGLRSFIEYIPGIKALRSITQGRIPVDSALLSRAATVEEELSALTKALEKLTKAAAVAPK